MRLKVLSNFVLGKNHLGWAVFAGKAFKPGDTICRFEGDIVGMDKLPKDLTKQQDRFVQVGRDTFMGPSGDVDDYINHSCNPNAGLKFTKAGILLTAIKSIKLGDEITWDYSTTLFENPWKMKCECRAKSCRIIVGDFTLLDEKLQKKYYKLNVIPDYIREYMEEEYQDLAVNKKPQDSTNYEKNNEEGLVLDDSGILLPS